MILADSSRTLTVSKASDKEYWIEMYNINTLVMEFSESISGNYIKMKDVEQNLTATKFAVTYNDDGIFKLRTFGRNPRTPEEIQRTDIDLNHLLRLDDWTMAIANFPDPFITCCFVSDELLFINLFYTPSCTHYHLFYNFEFK
jgi:hypothetical protein